MTSVNGPTGRSLRYTGVDVLVKSRRGWGKDWYRLLTLCGNYGKEGNRHKKRGPYRVFYEVHLKGFEYGVGGLTTLRLQHLRPLRF